MSVEMWNCHSWPLDVSNNLSGSCISNLVLASAFGICMCIYALVFPYIFLLVDCFEWALIGHIEKCRVHSALAVSNGGSIISFTFPYIFLLVDCFEWALIGHIEKCRVHSALAVSNGESIISFTFPYIFLLVDCFEWALIGHIEKWRVHSVLWQFWMGGGGEGGFRFTPLGVNLKIWAPRRLGVLIKKVFSLRVRPMSSFPLYLWQHKEVPYAWVHLKLHKDINWDYPPLGSNYFNYYQSFLVFHINERTICEAKHETSSVFKIGRSTPPVICQWLAISDFYCSRS